MKIIAGLGNPGRQYEHTRHNMGYDALDILAERSSIRMDSVRFQGMTGSGFIDGQKVLLIKPLTYMNLSGQALREAADFYKIDVTEDLVVLCDDISLAPGRIRIRKKGSAGGHNGLKNIIAHLGTQEFKRVKIGVGEKPAGWDLADYVLSHIAGEDAKLMEQACSQAADAAAALLHEDIQTVMNQYN